LRRRVRRIFASSRFGRKGRRARGANGSRSTRVDPDRGEKERATMKVRLKSNLLVITAETEDEIAEVAAWSAHGDDHVFALRTQAAASFRLVDLGPRPGACREPINVTSRSADPAIRLLSNFAETPFELDGQRYASVEAFWQGLKFPDESRRREVATLHGHAARSAGAVAPAAVTFEYGGRTIRVGTADHWDLMANACWAKFLQNQAAREALIGTGDRPLTHKVRHDSRNIPGVVMADIWMRIRRGLERNSAETE
jgi:predicted NAD-dependent protein-ADP-ribosyltransferase YbiA (DUF1768 family)